MQTIKLTTPLDTDKIKDLSAGDLVLLSGHVFTSRDAAHKRMVEMLNNNEDMPFDFNGEVVYYAGPCPTKPGEIIGSIGPTTSGRMDAYSPTLIDVGLKYMIGKGYRSNEVIESIKKHQGVYFSAIGGVAALMAKCVKEVTDIDFLDLGTEAIRKLKIEDLPVIVSVDSHGNSI